MTKKAARETIEAYKNITAWFSEEIPEHEMYEMFRYTFRFGEAETNVIMAALKLAGAKWKTE